MRAAVSDVHLLRGLQQQHSNCRDRRTIPAIAVQMPRQIPFREAKPWAAKLPHACISNLTIRDCTQSTGLTCPVEADVRLFLIHHCCSTHRAARVDLWQ